MIPTHQLDKANCNEVIVIKLGVSGSEYDYKKPHRHNYFEFFYFKNGGGSHMIDFIEFPIHPNSIHIIGPGQVHQVKRKPYCEGFVLLFELSAIKAPILIENFLFEHSCMNAKELNPTYKLAVGEKVKNVERIENIWKYYQTTNRLNSLSLLNEFYALCIDCMKKRYDKLINVNSDYLCFRKFVSQNYKELKKVKDYAELLKMSDKSLNKLAKKYAGKNASQIIYDQLIMEAKSL